MADQVLVVALHLLYVPVFHAFNLHIDSAVVHTHNEEASMFGYSVAAHIEEGRSWILVGAPNASTSARDVTNGGRVFKCSPKKKECDPLELDDEGPMFAPTNETVYGEIKSNQFLGATVHSMEGTIVACAPRYIYNGRAGQRRAGIGRCLVKQHGHVTEYISCKQDVDDTKEGEAFVSHCQLGFSAKLTNNGTRLVLGAPGKFYGQGQLILKDIDSIYTSGTREETSHKTYDYSQLGYAVAAGRLAGKDEEAYAVSAPRREKARGEVRIYRGQLNLTCRVTGNQMGEYFGYALAVLDLNGDNYEDLVVGSPMYNDREANLHECGRVVIFYQDSSLHKFKKDGHTLKGSTRRWARFGSALSSLGDLNKDGYQDLAVGAPYDGENGNGVVYIYHGGSPSIRTKPVQVIAAEQLSPQLSTFGFSLAGGTDMDRNLYPDLIVGAYESNRVVLLRSRPLIKMKTQIIVNPPVIMPEGKRCKSTNSGTLVSCYNVTVCIDYEGVSVPNVINLRLSLELEPGRVQSPRAYFATNMQRVLLRETRVHSSDEACMTPEEVHLQPGLIDTRLPIEVRLTYSLVEEDIYELPPMIDPYPPFVQNTTEFLKNCGEDDVCVADLSITARSPSPAYVLETEAEVDIEVEVINRGDDAHLAQVSIRLPAGTNYINVVKGAAENKVKCAVQTTPVQSVADQIICDIGNPLRNASRSRFGVRLSPARFPGTHEFLHFVLTASSSFYCSLSAENDTTKSDNVAVVDIPVKAVADLQMTGRSDPELLLFNESREKEPVHMRDVGKKVAHIYEVRNLGPSEVSLIIVDIFWPSYLDGSGSDLLYLTITPEIKGGTGSCYSGNTNHRNLKEEYDKEDKSRSASRVRRDLELVPTARCGPAAEMCRSIRCEITNMAAYDSVSIHVYSRLWQQNLVKAGIRTLLISSLAEARVVDVPYTVKPIFASVKAQARTRAESSARDVPLWLLILSTAIGAFLLMVLIIVLSKCGFFNRNRPGKMYDALHDWHELQNGAVVRAGGEMVEDAGNMN